MNATTIELEKAVAAGGSIAAEGKNISAEGNLSAAKAITLNGTGDVTTNETLVAGTDVAITATGEISTAKAITAGNNITLTGKDINASGNWTASNGNITVEGKNIANNDPMLYIYHYNIYFHHFLRILLQPPFLQYMFHILLLLKVCKYQLCNYLMEKKIL